MGQGKFSVNNKRQSIEQSEDLGLSNSRSNNNNKTPATTGYSKVTQCCSRCVPSLRLGLEESPGALVSVLTLFSVSVAMDSLDPSLLS